MKDKFFKINEEYFDTEIAFPPLDNEQIQTAIMVAKDENNTFQLYGWNKCIYPDGTEAWGWECIRPYKEEELNLIGDYIKAIKDNAEYKAEV